MKKKMVFSVDDFSEEYGDIKLGSWGAYCNNDFQRTDELKEALLSFNLWKMRRVSSVGFSNAPVEVCTKEVDVINSFSKKLEQGILITTNDNEKLLIAIEHIPYLIDRAVDGRVIRVYLGTGLLLEAVLGVGDKPFIRVISELG